MTATTVQLSIQTLNGMLEVPPITLEEARKFLADYTTAHTPTPTPDPFRFRTGETESRTGWATCGRSWTLSPTTRPSSVVASTRNLKSVTS